MTADGTLSDAHRVAEQAARTSYGRLIAIRAARTRDVAAAEDALADAFRTALETWPLRGTPDRNGGADLRGFDCSGLTQYVFARYGRILPREVRDQFRVGESIGRDQIQPGDLVFFSTTDPGPSHVAIAVNIDEFVHAPSSSGVVRVERINSRYWMPRVVGIRRLTTRE